MIPRAPLRVRKLTAHDMVDEMVESVLAARVGELQQAMVKQLSGLSEAQFSHGVCPACFDTAKQEFGF